MLDTHTCLCPQRSRTRQFTNVSSPVTLVQLTTRKTVPIAKLITSQGISTPSTNIIFEV